MTAREDWKSPDNIIINAKNNGLGCTILDKNEKMIAQTKGMPVHISEAVRQRNMVFDVCDEDELLGYVILSDGANEMIHNYRDKLFYSCLITMVAIIIIAVLFLVFLYWNIVRPFEKLRKFAGYVAQGNLDIPLDMDKGNLFGAFTESFDIMREELSLARTREYEAQKSKKELIASLSHDIKTPVASIRSATELLLVTTDDTGKKEKLRGIEKKTGQIELLIDNLFHSTLQELEVLEVDSSEESSNIISELINMSDYSGLVQDYEVEECVIICDKLRLGQVIDNIISNSYKYANSNIYVTTSIIEGNLQVSIKDEAAPLSDEEIRRCCEKYYRGPNSNGKNGSGIGLYISSYFMKKMGGALEVKADNGFRVDLYLPLA